MLRVSLALAVVIQCVAQEDPRSTPEVNRHLERGLQGPQVGLLRVGENPGTPVLSTGTTEGSQPAGVVSLITLRHKIPKKARQAFDRAIKHSRKRDYRAAAVELEKAVGIDPDFAEAHANLGAQYLRLGTLEKAVPELLRAAELEPNMAAVHINLAIAFLRQDNDGPAVTEARRAVSLAGGNHKAHYLLGLALGRSPATLAESFKHLEFAAERIPEAGQELQWREHALRLVPRK